MVTSWGLCHLVEIGQLGNSLYKLRLLGRKIVECGVGELGVHVVVSGPSAVLCIEGVESSLCVYLVPGFELLSIKRTILVVRIRDSKLFVLRMCLKRLPMETIFCEEEL